MRNKNKSFTGYRHDIYKPEKKSPKIYQLENGVLVGEEMLKDVLSLIPKIKYKEI